MMWGYPYGWTGFLWMIGSMVFWLLVAGLVIWALVRWLARPERTAPRRDLGGPTSGPSALEVLRQRYARGEIDAATFDQMRERLEASYAPRELEEPSTSGR
jgi:putative membrane protein